MERSSLDLARERIARADIVLKRRCAQTSMLTVLYGCLVLLVFAVGVASLMGARGPIKLLDACINIHALFGTMLCGLILARYQWCIKRRVPSQPADSRELSRHLSHVVYLFLYAVLGVRQSISIVNSLWHGGAMDFNLSDQHLRNGPDSGAFDPNDNLQLLIASGLFALAFARLLASNMWLRALQGTSIPKRRL